MKSILCICNTYLQLIISIVMRKALFADDHMTLILTDHSNDAKNVSFRLMQKKVFDDVLFANVKELDQGRHNLFQAIHAITAMTFGNIDKQYDYIKNKSFDTLLYYNESTFVSMLFAKLYKNKTNLKAVRFEEGIISYRNPVLINKRQDIAGRIRKKLKKKNISDITDSFYCIYPEFYNGELKVVRIPQNSLHNHQIIDLFKYVFLEGKKVLPYEQKYIYFSSVCDFEGEAPINEIGLIKLIAEKVGRENLLVKVHPRDKIERFKDVGVLLDQNSNVPWEAIQFGLDFSGHIFLTAHSSSVLTGNMLMEHPAETFFLYKLCDVEHNSIAQQAVDSLESLFEEYGLLADMRWIHVSNSIDEILC